MSLRNKVRRNEFGKNRSYFFWKYPMIITHLLCLTLRAILQKYVLTHSIDYLLILINLRICRPKKRKREQSHRKGLFKYFILSLTIEILNKPAPWLFIWPVEIQSKMMTTKQRANANIIKMEKKL